jgi:hypothetical protein
VRKIDLLPLAALILTLMVFAFCFVNELNWVVLEQNPVRQTVREVIGLPSIALGTNYGATRNPLLEVYCTSLYDIPGGYCYIYIASFVGWPMQSPDFFKTVPGFNLTAMRS